MACMWVLKVGVPIEKDEVSAGRLRSTAGEPPEPGRPPPARTLIHSTLKCKHKGHEIVALRVNLDPAPARNAPPMEVIFLQQYWLSLRAVSPH